MKEIRPISRCDACVTLPGSKSYTHRALIVAALAGGESFLVNSLKSEDTGYTVRGLEKFGVRIFGEEEELHVLGKGGEFSTGETNLFVGNSGTSMRFLTGLAALRAGSTFLDGSERMRKRPMAPLLEGLNSLGCRTYSVQGDGCPPVMIESQPLRGGSTRIRGDESSQFLSALLMVAPYAREDVFVEVTGALASQPYVDVTCDVMTSFGVEVERQGDRSFYVRRGQSYQPRKYLVEGDASHASYFFAAAAVTRGRVRVENFRADSIQGDTGFLKVMERMGCEVAREDHRTDLFGKELRGIEIDMNAMPDLVPTLAVTAAFARGKTLIRNIGHLRFKESDRIRALSEGLRSMGIGVREGGDWLAIEGGKAHGALIETYEDHRLAMSFAIAGLAVPGIRIQDEGCVNKSFPGFWEAFQGLY
jgi:3-phosphoshikimate 1-carboxyvinyltransferase